MFLSQRHQETFSAHHCINRLTRFLCQPSHFPSPCPVSLRWFSRIQKKNTFMFLNCATFGKYLHLFLFHIVLFLLPFLSCSGKNWLQKWIALQLNIHVRLHILYAQKYFLFLRLYSNGNIFSSSVYTTHEMFSIPLSMHTIEIFLRQTHKYIHPIKISLNSFFPQLLTAKIGKKKVSSTIVTCLKWKQKMMMSLRKYKQFNYFCWIFIWWISSDMMSW